MADEIAAKKAQIIEDINKYLDEKLTAPDDQISKEEVKNMIDEALKNQDEPKEIVPT